MLIDRINNQILMSLAAQLAAVASERRLIDLTEAVSQRLNGSGIKNDISVDIDRNGLSLHIVASSDTPFEIVFTLTNHGYEVHGPNIKSQDGNITYRRMIVTGSGAEIVVLHHCVNSDLNSTIPAQRSA